MGHPQGYPSRKMEDNWGLGEDKIGCIGAQTTRRTGCQLINVSRKGVASRAGFRAYSCNIMDTTTAAVIVIVVVLFGLIILGFVWRYRTKGKAQIKGPFGTGLKVEGENAPGPGVRLKDAQAGGSIRAQDATGRGADAEKLNAKGDIEVTSSSGPPPPKT